MGFWNSFLGLTAANAVREINKAEKENKKWNDLFHEISCYEEDFTRWLRSKGCDAICCFDVEAVNNGNITPEKVKIDTYRRKMEKYIQLGGMAEYIHELEELDEGIEKVTYLKEKNSLDRQQEFEFWDYALVKKIIEEEESRILHRREQSLNQIIGTDMNTLSGVEFEGVCQKLIQNMGFETETTKASGDGGIDLVAYNYQPLLCGKYIIQCKRYKGSVGEPIIRDLYGVVMSERANKGILITTGYFTKSAIAFADGKPIELIDGESLQKLLLQYGLKREQQCMNDMIIDITGGKTLDEVIQNDYCLEEYHSEFLELKEQATTTNEERTIAEYINWLIDKIDSENLIVFNHEDRLVFLKEINVYIEKYLKVRCFPKSRLLSYLYQMIYTQNAILLERFTEAKEMFVNMMKNEDIQFNVMETLGETGKTAEIFNNSGAFSFLFATWCNMNQLAYFSHDDALRRYLSDSNLFFGVSSLQESRIEDNLRLIESGKSGANPIFFQKQKKLLSEIDSILLDEIKTKIFFRIDKSEVIESFYDYAYWDGKTVDKLLGFNDYTIEGNLVVINNYGKINLENALKSYIPFNE